MFSHPNFNPLLWMITKLQIPIINTILFFNSKFNKKKWKLSAKRQPKSNFYPENEIKPEWSCHFQSHQPESPFDCSWGPSRTPLSAAKREEFSSSPRSPRSVGSRVARSIDWSTERSGWIRRWRRRQGAGSCWTLPAWMILLSRRRRRRGWSCAFALSTWIE